MGCRQENAQGRVQKNVCEQCSASLLMLGVSHCLKPPCSSPSTSEVVSGYREGSLPPADPGEVGEGRQGVHRTGRGRAGHLAEGAAVVRAKPFPPDAGPCSARLCCCLANESGNLAVYVKFPGNIYKHSAGQKGDAWKSNLGPGNRGLCENLSL